MENQKRGTEDFIIKGKARDGTTTFFAYASIYVIKKDKRFTLALKAVRKNEGILAVLKWLLDRFERFGGVVRCLYLDRGFYSVEVLRFLIYEKDIPFVMAAPKRGKKGGINGLIKREGPGVFPYKVRSPFYGEISVTVAIVSRNLKGRWGKHRRETYAYVIHCFPFSFSSLFEKYRHRFGIETSHRVWGQARAWTTSCSASRRFLLLGIAVLFCNLWSFIKWMAISIKRRGGRLVFHSWFTFGRMCSFLSRALERRYGVVEEVIIHV